MLTFLYLISHNWLDFLGEGENLKYFENSGLWKVVKNLHQNATTMCIYCITPPLDFLSSVIQGVSPFVLTNNCFLINAFIIHLIYLYKRSIILRLGHWVGVQYKYLPYTQLFLFFCDIIIMQKNHNTQKMSCEVTYFCF